MVKATSQPISVSWERLKPLLEQARAANINEHDLFTSLNLDPNLLDPTAHSIVSLADYYRLQSRLSILIGDETLHLSSRQLLPGSTDFVLQHVGDCTNLFEVMQLIARSYNLLHGGQFNSVIKKKDSIDYIIDDRDFPYTADQKSEFIYFSIECILIFLHCMLIALSSDAERSVTGLQLRRPTPGGDCGHLGYWDAPIKFGAERYRISFERETSLRPFSVPPVEALTANAVYQKINEVIAGRTARTENTQTTSSLVRDALSRGVVEQADVAAQMSVSIATLRRRLTEESTNFRELRREVLNDTAQRLLLNKRSVADVSDALGFSEFRAFSRAFKDWNGITPKAFILETKTRSNS